MKLLWKNKIFIVLILLFIFLFPSAISLPQQNRAQNIITAIGIDKNNDEFEVSIQYLIPYGSSPDQDLQLSSVKDKSVGQAIEKLNLNYGKLSGFAHCRAIVFNDEAGKEGLTNILSYILRTRSNTNNIILINTADSSKKLLESVKSLDSEFYVVLGGNSVANDQKHYQNLKSISDYFDVYLSNNDCIAITNIDLQESSDEQGSSSGSSSGGGEGQESGGASQSSSSQSKISNTGKLAIVKNNKLVFTLDESKSENLRWFNDKIKDLTIQISNFSDKTFQNADLFFDVYDKSTSYQVSFIDNIPHMHVNICANIALNQVLVDSLQKNLYEVSGKLFSDKLISKVKDEILLKLKSAEQDFKLNHYDVINCYENFYKFKNSEFKKFLNSLQQDEYFIDNVVFDYNIILKQMV